MGGVQGLREVGSDGRGAGTGRWGQMGGVEGLREVGSDGRGVGAEGSGVSSTKVQP